MELRNEVVSSFFPKKYVVFFFFVYIYVFFKYIYIYMFFPVSSFCFSRCFLVFGPTKRCLYRAKAGSFDLWASKNQPGGCEEGPQKGSKVFEEKTLGLFRFFEGFSRVFRVFSRVFIGFSWFCEVLVIFYRVLMVFHRVFMGFCWFFRVIF